MTGVPNYPSNTEENQRGGRLQILIVSDVFPPMVGGAGVVPEALASCFPEAISVLAAKSGPPTEPIEDWAAFDRRFPFRVYRTRSLYKRISFNLPPRLRGLLQFACNLLWIRPLLVVRILRILHRNPAQVLCVNTIGVGYWMPKVFRRLKPRLKVIFYLHGEELSDGKAPTRFYRLMQTSLVDADALVAVSSYTARVAVAQGASAARISVINNGVDPVRFSPGPKDPEIQARFGLNNKRVLLCLARLDERKGQDMLIQAMPEILAAVPEAVLLLVGSGGAEPRLRQLVQDLQLQSRVLFAGSASDEQVVPYYRTADVYAMPNRTTEGGDTEGFGLVFLEAGACAKPVIGGMAGGVPDAIVEGKTGLLVDGRCSQSIAAACIRLLADPGLAAEMGQAGLDHARSSSWANRAVQFLSLCEAAAKNEPLPGNGFTP